MLDVKFVSYIESKHFEQIQELNKQEGWTQLVERNEETKQAWSKSNIAYVILKDDDEVIGYTRGLTDEHVTLYICEMLISKPYRGLGLGGKLLNNIQGKNPTARMEMLASRTSHTFYEAQNFRPFYGYRRTYQECKL
ncbi:GCN5 family acetyltransferase [Fictibacillus phosphorivorans]|uniref:GCN5 family acetyltransferase n=1 Tax=Fictibacillus phosphorivorans TaxID=1221500 RepID=A0A160IJV9_9BACL|nr:GNAT family N-acetyltransferase [Fictibacillus phosphorivorans]ANC76171.1 GCN5 family acetyltransferase [Fictibacillus phosphorivorans]